MLRNLYIIAIKGKDKLCFHDWSAHPACPLSNNMAKARSIIINLLDNAKSPIVAPRPPPPSAESILAPQRHLKNASKFRALVCNNEDTLPVCLFL